MDYGNILSRAWQIVWQNKFMIVLGFLAALGSSGGGGGGGRNMSFDNSDFEAFPDVANQAEAFFTEFWPLLLAAACFFFLLGLVLWVIGLAAQGGLIHAAARLDAGEKLTFGEAFRGGWSKIGRLIGMALLLILPFVLFALVIGGLVFAIVGASLFSGGEGLEAVGVLTIFAICGMICLIFPLTLLIIGIYAYAQRGIMLQDLGIGESISHGWHILRTHLAETIVLGLIFMVIGFILSAVILAVFIPFAFLSFGPAIFSFIQGEAPGAFQITMLVIGGLFLAILSAAISSVVRAFQSTAVTLAYQEFLNKKASA